MAKRWPNGLDDEGAIERLQSLLLLACEGNKDLSHSREYTALRRSLLTRDDLSDVLPSYIRSQRDLAYFWAYIKGVSDKWEPRREHIRQTFAPLFDRVEGRTRPPVRSSNWTGKRTAAQQATVVLSLGYDALDGLTELIDNLGRGLHNGGPVDPERREALENLRELHTALGDLIHLAENEAPLTSALGRLKASTKAYLRWTANPPGFAVGALPLTGVSTMLGIGVMYGIEAICGKGGETMGAAVVATHAAVALARRKENG